MVADRKLSEAELFQVVGAGWKQYESEKRKKTFQEKLKGKPVFSLFLLFLIVLGCIFANVVANHDPSGFYLQNLNTHQERNLSLERIRLEEIFIH